MNKRIKLPHEYNPPISFDEWVKIQEENRRQKKEKKMLMEALFPTLSQLPLPWLILAIICILFSLFTCIL